ncbi:MAG: methyltransferase domain-containing protein [Pseudomonadota bacterium]
MADHVCPWYLAYTFDNIGRKLVHPPDRVFGPHLFQGATVLDVGPGLGFSSISMAGLIGPTGRVIAVDLQQKMLDRLNKRAEKAGVAARIETRRCGPASLGVDDLKGRVDFANAFWMVHEVPDQPGLLAQIHQALAGPGRLLLVEPRFHVSEGDFVKTIDLAREAGFTPDHRPAVTFSRAVLLKKDEAAARDAA